MRGKLIVFEGIDGSGKTTQAKMLRDYLEEKGELAFYIHFPVINGNYSGDMIASYLRGDFGPKETVNTRIVADMFAQNRGEFSGLIRELLEEGVTVIADRYVASTAAFQCIDCLPQTIKNWYNLEVEKFGIVAPDLELFIDVPPSHTSTKPKKETYLGDKEDILEKDKTFQQKVYDEYKEMFQAGLPYTRWDVNGLDKEGNRLSPEEVFKNVLTAYKSKNYVGKMSNL